jgi:hypothetical protein
VGFSWVGLVIGAAVLAPNLLVVFFPPRDGLPVVRVHPALALLERVGQTGCLALLALAGDRFSRQQPGAWAVLLVISVLAYYSLWARYLLGGRTSDLLFAHLGFLPIPMAVFPVLAFGSAAAWASSGALGVAVVILAVGHFAVSWASYRATRAPEVGAAAASADRAGLD